MDAPSCPQRPPYLTKAPSSAEAAAAIGKCSYWLDHTGAAPTDATSNQT